MQILACSRCLLSENVPGVKVHPDGICSVCKNHDEAWGNWNEVKNVRLAALEKIFENIKGKNRAYDVVVPISGGKDSTYVLYTCKKRFNLKCLAVTWDNGFLTDHARQNIEQAVNVLGVDHMYYGLSPDLLMRLYSLFFLKTGFFCPVCMRGIQATIERAATAFGISLVVKGTSKRTEEYIAPEFFMDGNWRFFNAVLKGEALETEALPLQYGSEWSRIIVRAFTYSEIELPDYLDWNYDEIYETISSELGWKAPRSDAEHTDCKVDNIVNYFRHRKFPALTLEMLRFSKLVTAGVMTREEALQRIKEVEASAEPENLEWFLNTLEISREEMETILADPFRHLAFNTGGGIVWRTLRQVKRRILNPLMGQP
ncbi:MAG: hypothetical protein JW963_02525 [Anaerolineales bacterium]|nr:hypothetical protein [Anaerolineales bacterium]